MRVLFTKQQEEITTVKKSVMQITVDTGNQDFKAVESPVIEMEPEPHIVGRPTFTSTSPRFFRQQTKTIPDLSGRSNQVTDIVDLHRRMTNKAPGRIAYSETRALRGSPLIEGYVDDGVTKSYDSFAPHQDRVRDGQKDDHARRLSNGRPLHSDKRVHKFIAAQEMTEHQSGRAKKATIEITV